MLQPDAVYVLKAHEPVYSLTFLNQQLLAGKKNGNVALYCLSVSSSSSMFSYIAYKMFLRVIFLMACLRLLFLVTTFQLRT